MYRYSRAEEASSLIAETEALLGTWDDDFDGASVKDAADRTLAKVHGAYVGPVRCLPIEILSRCFHFLAAADPPVYTTYTGEDASQPTEIALGWIKVTHVCRFWRHVAIGNPILWRNFSSFAMRRICFDTILQRTKAVPLSITYRRPTLHFEEPHSIRNLFLVDRPRIRSLHIYASSTKRLVDTLRDPLPSLESLFVSFSAVNETDEGFDGQEVDGIDTDDDLDQYRNDLEDLPATYPGSSSPVSNIKTLTVVGFPFPKTPFHFAPQLTTLVVSLPVRYNSPFIPGSVLYPSMDEFVAVLEGTPTLTTIDFRHCTPQDFVHAPPETVPRTISLPNLRNVTLIATRDGLNSMLSFIKVPNARLRVGLYGLPDNVEEHLSATFAAIKHTACRDITSLRSLHICVETYQGCPRVVVSNSPVLSWNLSHNPDEIFADHQTATRGLDIDMREPEFAFGFQLAGTSATPAYTAAISIMKAFDHPAVECLSVRHSKNSDYDLFWPFIRRYWFCLTKDLVNLRHLFIEHVVLSSEILHMLLFRYSNSDKQILGAYSVPGSIEEADDNSELHLPKLSTVASADVHLFGKAADLIRILKLRKDFVDGQAGATSCRRWRSGNVFFSGRRSFFVG